MALLLLILLASLTTFDFSLCQWVTDGTTKTLTFTTSTLFDSAQINWIFQNKNRNETIFQCLPFDKMTCFPEDIARDLYSANITSNSSSYISVLTIKNVSPALHNKVWFCNYNTGNKYSESARYGLKVFAIAQNPTCQQVILLAGSNIQMHCGSNKVFPEAICLFTVKTNASEEQEIKQGSIAYTNVQNATTEYYKTNCTYTVSAAILGPGSHMFRVVMYPNITSNITEEIKRTSENASSIFLGKASFQCTISNLLNWTDKKEFQPNVSYPPDTVTFNITKQDFDLCNATKIIISGTCLVSESNPEPSVTVDINNSSIDFTTVKRDREYTFNILATSTGIRYISCNVNSNEYSQNASSITNVTIKGPPDIPTIFKKENEEYKNQPKHWLEITKDDTITCQAKGGYPISKNLSLKCGTEEIFATNQDQVSLALNISNVRSGTCKCVVWHASICLQNTTTIQFNVLVSENSPITEHDFEKIYLEVGVTVCCFVAIIALMFIASNLRQGQLKKSSSKQ